VWALGRLLEPAAFAARRAERLPGEGDAEVIAEWQGAAA
jgi:hypothetical protein